jgi:WhiB family redox-sensing transcriptional regulator
MASSSFPVFTEPTLCSDHEDPDVFFNADFKSTYVQAAEVKNICKGCPSKDACLEYAMKHAVVGIWGGTTSGERDALRKQLNIEVIPIKIGENYV